MGSNFACRRIFLLLGSAAQLQKVKFWLETSSSTRLVGVEGLKSLTNEAVACLKFAHVAQW